MSAHMTDFPYKIMGFDLDGTLLDTSDELTAAVNHTLGLLGHAPLSRDAVKPMIGLGAKHMLKVGLERAGEPGEQTLREYLPKMLEYYGDHLGSGSHPYPGLITAMDALASKSVTLAVVTNKYENFAETLLGAVGMRTRFACVIGGDTMGKGKSKPHRAPIDEMVRRCLVERGGGTPDETSAAFIGDSIYDIMAAHNAGLPAIAVSFGFLHQPAEELGADAVIDHYDELIPTLERLGARVPTGGAA